MDAWRPSDASIAAQLRLVETRASALRALATSGRIVVHENGAWVAPETADDPLVNLARRDADAAS